MIDVTNSNRKILVTGASGFVGQHTIASLLKAGFQVLATTTQIRNTLPSHPNLVWSVWDSTKTTVPEIEWAEVETVIHLIMPNLPTQEIAHANDTFKVIALSTQHILDAAVNSGVRKFLLASSGDALGGRSEPAQETDVLYNPESHYGTSKACAELITNTYASVISTTILRFYHPYGTGGEKFLISKLIERIREGRIVFLEGADGIIINPVWAEELAQGITMAIGLETTGIFHLGGPDDVSMRNVIETIGELLDQKPIIEMSDARSNNFYCGDMDRSQRVLNYNPKVGIRVGLEMLINHPKVD